MQVLDLFNTKFERELTEGAVDNTIARLIEPLSRRAADIRTELRSGRAEPSKVQALEKEYEDLVQKRLDIILDRSPKGVEETEGGIGQDLVTPQQRVQQSTPQRQTPVQKVGSTVKQAARWIAGKGGPGREGPTYESELAEQEESAVANARFVWDQITKAVADNVDFATIRWLNNSTQKFTRNQLYHLEQKVRGMSRQQRNEFVLKAFANPDNLMYYLGGLKKITPRPQIKPPVDPAQPALDLPKPTLEDQKKKINGVSEPKDPSADLAVRTAMQRFPSASTPLAAVALDTQQGLEKDEKNIQRIRSANSRQDELLKALVDLDNEQGAEIDQLDSENDRLENQLQQLLKVNQKLEKTVNAITGQRSTRKSADTTPAKTEPATSTDTTPKAATDNTVDIEARRQAADLKQQIKQLQGAIPSAGQEELATIQSKIDQLNTKLDQVTSRKKSDVIPVQKELPLGKDKPRKPVIKPPTDIDRPTKIPAKSNKDELDVLGIAETKPSTIVNRSVAALKAMPKVDAKLQKHQQHRQDLERQRDALDAEMSRVAGQEQDYWQKHAPRATRLKDPSTTLESNMSELDAMRQDLELMSDRQFMAAYKMSKQAFQQQYRSLLKPSAQQDAPVKEDSEPQMFVIVADGKRTKAMQSDMADKLLAAAQRTGKYKTIKKLPAKPEDLEEGWQDFNKVEPYAVCLAGKPVKKFDYYEQARRFHDNWKKKLYREGNKEKADKITLMPLNLDEAQQWQGNLGAEQAQTTDHTMDEAIQYVKGNYPYNKKFRITRAEPGFRADLDPDQYRRSNAQVTDVDSAMDYLQLKENPVMSGSRQISASLGYSWHTNENRNKGIAVFYYEDRGMGWDEVIIAAKDKNNLAGAVQVFRDAGIIPTPKVKEAANPAQQAAIAIAMKKADKKPKTDESKEAVFKNHKIEVEYPEGKGHSHIYHRREPYRLSTIFSDANSVAYRNPRAKISLFVDGEYIPNYEWQEGVDAPNGGIGEAQTDFQKRRQRERDIDAGKPVTKQRQPRQTDYQRRRAQDKKDMELGEGMFSPLQEEDNSVADAILKRVLVRHKDWLVKFGPEKIMQAADEVAYNVGNTDEIGSSDVSGYVRQVAQILGVDQLDEKWSQKYKKSINCAHPKGFSQKAHCAGRKK